MEVKQVKNILEELYKNGRRSTFLVGSPGIGKSKAVEEAARRIAKSMNKTFIHFDGTMVDEILKSPSKYFVFVDFRLTELEPSDLQGIPKEAIFAGNYPGVAYRPFGWVMCLAKCSGILFLDELTNVQRMDVISASYKLVLDKRAGEVSFSDDVMVIAAGNDPEESSAANLLPTALIDRFIKLKVDIPKLESWAEWMDGIGQDWDRRTIAYLGQFPEDFLRLPTDTETLDNFPTPRSWTSIATLIEKLPDQMKEDVSIGDLGLGTGRKFSAYLRANVPPIEELIKSPAKFEKLKLDAQYLSSVALGAWMRDHIEKRDFKDVHPLAESLGGERREFLMLSLMATGPARTDVIIELLKNKNIKKWLEEIVQTRFAISES